jgi:hypothetical protein
VSNLRSQNQTKRSFSRLLLRCVLCDKAAQTNRPTAWPAPFHAVLADNRARPPNPHARPRCERTRIGTQRYRNPLLQVRVATKKSTVLKVRTRISNLQQHAKSADSAIRKRQDTSSGISGFGVPAQLPRERVAGKSNVVRSARRCLDGQSGSRVKYPIYSCKRMSLAP